MCNHSLTSEKDGSIVGLVHATAYPITHSLFGANSKNHSLVMRHLRPSRNPVHKVEAYSRHRTQKSPLSFSGSGLSVLPRTVPVINMVPKAGLEPAWVAPQTPQACVSTNSTTSAILIFSDQTTTATCPAPEPVPWAHPCPRRAAESAYSAARQSGPPLS